MNKDLQINLDFKQLWATILRYQATTATITMTLVIGLTLYQVSLVTQVEPDGPTIEAERAKLRASSVRFDQETIKDLNSRSSVPKQPDLTNLGKSDPFSP